MLCYIEKNSEAVKLCQDLDKLFDKTKLRKYMAFLSGTKNLRHIEGRLELGHRMSYLLNLTQYFLEFNSFLGTCFPGSQVTP